MPAQPGDNKLRGHRLSRILAGVSVNDLTFAKNVAGVEFAQREPASGVFL